MAGNVIKQIVVQVEYEGGATAWYGATLGDGCRTVIVGADAYGAAGTYYEPGHPGFLEVSPPAFADRPVLPPEELVGQRPKLYGMAESGTEPEFQAVARPLPDEGAALPPLCEYINGKWYCW